MAKNEYDSDNSSQFRYSTLISNGYLLVGSVILIGAFNMYRGLFRFSFGFITGLGVGVAVGFALADTSVGQYILKSRSKST